MTSVLVIDDEPSICWGFQNLMGSLGMTVLIAGNAKEGLKQAQHNPVDLVLLDVRLPDGNGLDLIQKLQVATGDAPVIVMTAYGDLETAVIALNRGAIDYLHKPFPLAEAQSKCQRAIAYRETSSSNEKLPREATQTVASNQLVGSSPSMQRLFHQIALVADSNLSVLIVGETGTGKELVAEAIHRHSSRRDRPYISVAPVTYNPTLLESELFGYVKGAFTGAAEDRTGVFHAANGGTIFLDEIGDLPLNAQVKLLRVLEQKTYSRVGDSRSLSCDVRVVAATNTDLRKAVAEGRFREDLLYRLSGIVLEIPALRQRLEDVEPLTRHFLRMSGYTYADHDLPSSVLEFLKSQPWPGNVRELRNAIARAAVMARRRPLDVNDFLVEAMTPHPEDHSPFVDSIKQWVAQELNKARSDDSDRLDAKVPLFERFMTVAEPILLQAVMNHTGGNRSLAAELLGIHRATLRERLLRYQIE